MCEGMTAITTIPGTLPTNVINVAGCFKNCVNLIHIDVNQMIAEIIKTPDTNKNLSELFFGCNALTGTVTQETLDLLNQFNDSQISGMFAGCTSLTNYTEMKKVLTLED